MKIISDIPLKSFEFWSGAVDTAKDLTDEQFDRIESELEGDYPDGMTNTELNDLFWFEREYIYKVAGVYPKYFKLTSNCGEVKYVKAEDEDDEDEVDRSKIEHEEVDASDCQYEDVENVSYFDFDEFASSRFFRVSSYIHHNVIILRCTDSDEVARMMEALKKCEIEEIKSVTEEDVSDAEDWFDYDGDERAINEFVYDEDSAFDICNIPTYALSPIENDDFSGLDEEEEREINDFMRRLSEGCPNGYTIDWEDLDNPFFTQCPEWGLPGDCFVGRIYPIKSIDNE